MRRTLLVLLAALLTIPAFATAAHASAQDYPTSPCGAFIERHTSSTGSGNVASASTFAFGPGGANPYCNSQVCAQIFADLFGSPVNSSLQCASATGVSYSNETAGHYAQAFGNDSYSYHSWCTTSTCGTRWL